MLAFSCHGAYWVIASKHDEGNVATLKITKSQVDKIVLTDKDQLFWDADLKGFGLKVTPGGSKTYIFQYRYPAGRGGSTYRITIGKHGSPWTPDTARGEARSLASRVAQGEDPRAEKLRQKAIPTVAQFCDTYLLHGLGTKKQSTIDTDKGRIERHIKPLLGKMRISDVTPAHVRKFQTSIANGETKTDVKTGLRGRAIVRGGKGTAARTLGLLGGIFSYAVELGLLERNPAHGVKRFPDKKNERFLSLEEIRLAGEILSKAKAEGINDKAIDIIRLLIFTGARRGEIQNLQWEEVDFERKLLLLDDSKTGQKIIRLSTPALTILTERKPSAGKAEGYVFPASDGDGAYTATSRIWSKLRASTSLEDVRLHDLRHSFASLAIAQGASLAIIGKLLGHANASTTQRYAHLADDPIAAANEQVGEAIAEMFGVPSKT